MAKMPADHHVGWFAAALRLDALTDHVEFIGVSPTVDGILMAPFKLDQDGSIGIPDTPGLGVTPDPEKVARYSPKAERLFEG